MRDKKAQKPRGIISLLALLIMATITTTAVGAAGIILAELRQTENLDQSVSAVYAAEAGLEDGLYVVKINRSSSTTLADTQTLLGDTANRAALPNTATWARTSSLENRYILSRLDADKSASVDMYNTDDPGAGSGLVSLKINWSINCNKIVQLETTMLTWARINNSITFDPATQQVFKYTQACNQVASDHCTDIVLNSVDGVNFSPLQPYRFTFRVLIPQDAESKKCSAENIVVTGYDHSDAQGNVIDIPTRIEVKAVGSFARSQQALTASIPWKAPISGLLGFVLFSDAEIRK